MRQLHRHRGGQGGFAHAAFAHQHHQAMAIGGNVVHQLRQAGRLGRRHSRRCKCRRSNRRVAEQMPQGIEPHQIERLEWDAVLWQCPQRWRHVLQRPLLARRNGDGQRVTAVIGRQHAIDDQVLLAQPDIRQFLMRAIGLAQRGALGTRDQHQTRVRGVGQGLHRRLVLGALFFQPRQRAQARRIALARFQETTPRARQLQKANGVPRGGRVENDVVEPSGQGRVGQQLGEFVKGRNLGGASARELFFDALDHIVGQNATHRADDAITVGLRCALGIDLQC